MPGMFSWEGGRGWVFGKGFLWERFLFLGKRFFLRGFGKGFLSVVVESGLGVRGVRVQGLVVEGTGVLVEGGGAGDLGFGDCGCGFGGCAAHFLGWGGGVWGWIELNWEMMVVVLCGKGGVDFG